LVFKRRDKRSYGQIIFGFIYPKGGWTRAVYYIQHRVNRLPDSPERIARGIFAGVATTFTPFFGVHFVIAFIVAKAVRGNVFAALTATFFGNPLTYVPIAVASLKTGHWLLGTQPDREINHSVQRSFVRAVDDLWDNFKAIFTGRDPHWDRLLEFYDQVFYPFMIGSLIPGVIAGLIAYYVSVPVIRAYQKRRKGRIKAKFALLKRNAKRKADAARKSD
jgi:uncharacterized protein